MPELNPQGDSNGAQPPVAPIVTEPVITAPVIIEPAIVEPVQPIEQIDETINKLVENPEFVDKLISNPKFAEKFYSQAGDGVKTMIDNQIKKAEIDIQEASQITPVKTEVVPVVTAPTPAPAKVETQQSLETPKEADEVAVLTARLEELEGSKLEESIRNIPEIRELSQLDQNEANRFIGRAKEIAIANKLKSNEVSRIFAEGSNIAKDVNNQLFSLQGDGVNKPINKPIINETVPPVDKKANMLNAFFSNE